MRTWGAGDLVKRSACQIKYLSSHYITPETTDAQLKGQAAQIKRSKKRAYKEMRGEYPTKDGKIYFVVDELSKKLAVEHKNIEGVPEDWYFNSSLVQAALYKSFIMCGAIEFVTAQFFRKHGLYTCKITPQIEYRLNFGGDIYNINVSSPKRIIKYYTRKIKAILGSWEEVRQYDLLYKFNDYNKLSKYIIWKQLY